MTFSDLQTLVELLTLRETETLSLLLRGLNEQGVGEKLGLSKQTVHVYVKNLYRTFRVRDKGQLLALFIPQDTIAYLDARRTSMAQGKGQRDESGRSSPTRPL